MAAKRVKSANIAASRKGPYIIMNGCYWRVMMGLASSNFLGLRVDISPWFSQKLKLATRKAFFEPTLSCCVQDRKTVQESNTKFWKSIGVLWKRV
jgi:hypothetical protein